MPVPVRISAMIDPFKDQLQLILRDLTQKFLMSVLILSPFPHLFSGDPGRRPWDRIDPLIEQLKSCINALDTGQRRILNIFQFLIRKRITLIPDLVIIPETDRFLMINIHILCPFFKFSLGKNQGITEHNTAWKFNIDRI